MPGSENAESAKAPKSPLFKRRPISDFFGYVPWSEIWEVDKVLEDMSKRGAKTIQHAEEVIQHAEEVIQHAEKVTQKAQENTRKDRENTCKDRKAMESALRQLERLGY